MKTIHNAALLIFFVVLCTTAHAQSAQRILVLGDSLSAAYGIPIEKGWVALMEKQLAKDFPTFEIVNASVSGETTDGGLRQLPGLLEEFEPQLVILELGANDGLRGFPIKTIRQNLETITQLSQEAGAKVLIIGMHILPNYGPIYSEQFFANFEAVATSTNSPLVPFLLDNVALHPNLMQDDRLHPTAEAQPILLDNVYPSVTKILAEL